MSVSKCVFKSMSFGYTTKTSSFGAKRRTVYRTIGVDRSQRGVDTIGFSSPGNGEIHGPNSLLEVEYTYGGEEMDYLLVQVRAKNVPIGSEVSLVASNLDTTPPIFIQRCAVKGASVCCNIQIPQVPLGYSTKLSLSFWRNGRQLASAATMAIEVHRVFTGGEGNPVHHKRDVYGQNLAGPRSVSRLIGEASMALVPYKFMCLPPKREG